MIESQKRDLANDREVAAGLALFQAWTTSQMAYRGLPGLSAGLVYDQDLIWSGGFGYADLAGRTPASPATIYRIASISKLFTATAVMQLRDQGKLRLDDRVADHLPWFTIRNRFPEAPAITIRHLITHTSGLPRESRHPYWSDFNFPVLEDVIERLPSQETPIAPEMQLKYSNLAFALAGEIVSCASGEPYAGYVHKHILEPLGMTSTSVVFPEEHRARTATGYGRRLPDGTRDLKPFADARSLAAATGLSSNVEDLARFAMLQFRDGAAAGGGAGGAQILKGATIREMHRPQWLRPDWQSGYALGFAVRRLGGKLVASHGGAYFGYRTHIAVMPEDKLGVIVLTNADDGVPEMYVDKAFELLGPPLRKAVAAAPKPPAPFDPQWGRYVGCYRNGWGDMDVVRLGEELGLYSAWDPDPTTALCRLKPEPGAERTFRMDGGGMPGELVRFEVDDAGNVTRMWVGEVYHIPVGEDTIDWGLDLPGRPATIA